MRFFSGSGNFSARSGAVVPPALVVNHFDIAEAQAFAADEDAEFNATAFNEGAVAGIEIAHEHFAGSIESDFAMDCGNGRIRNAVIVAYGAANAIGAAFQGEDSAFGDARLDLENGHTRSFKERNISHIGALASPLKRILLYGLVR